jgi:hypothetical protein
MYIKIQLPYVNETTIVWEEQVEKALVLCYAEGNSRVVLMMQMYERITNTNVITSVTTAEIKDIISRTCVSVQEICKIGDISHMKWSITLEAQNSSLIPMTTGGKMIKDPVTQELRTSWWHTLLFITIG